MLHVEIRVKGQIDEDWESWFGNLSLSHRGSDETVLAGTVLDQAELYGLLTRLRDLGLSLIAVRSEELENSR